MPMLVTELPRHVAVKQVSREKVTAWVVQLEGG